MTTRILSGCQPTGALHLGNYFGAVKQFIELQRDGEAFYFIADLHALTTIRDPEELSRMTHSWALDYLALGLDPEIATIYRQSDVPQVSELAWVLSTVTPMGLLQRCHSYKDKVAEGISPDHGLFAYPVLMAADILVCRSHRVPVGQDQKQHVEVTRDIAAKFNQTYGEVFPLPDEITLEATGKIPGVDGRKMSGSYGNYLGVFDPEKELRKRIMSIVTDSTPVEEPKNPEGNVIIELYRLVASPERVEDLAQRFRAGGLGYGHAKQELYEAFLEHFDPPRKRREELSQKPEVVEEILQQGAKRARGIADETMAIVRQATGVSRRVT